MSFIHEPTAVLVKNLGQSLRDETSFWYGRLAMALEVVTLIKTLEDVPGTSATETGRQETIAVLQGFLKSQGFDELAYKHYDVLNEWRRLKFVAYHELSPSAIASAGARDDGRLRESQPESGPSSPLVSGD